jgi:hypothetical protein
MAANAPRLLIATGEAVARVDDVPSVVRAMIESASELFVMTPILTSALRWLASDTDRARYEADERLSTVLGQIAEIAPGTQTRAQVGDETPMDAFEDAIRQFSPDHILIALRADDHDAWQERRLVEKLLSAFGIPVTVFDIDRGGRPPAPAQL